MPSPDSKSALLEIHLNALERDCQEQPKLMWRFSQALAKANAKVARLKASLKLREAEIIMEVHANPMGFGIEKITEKTLFAVTHTDDTYKEFTRQMLDAEENVEYLKGMVFSLVDRREQLSNAVKLHGQNYFSRPPVDTTELAEENRTSTMQGINSRIGESMSQDSNSQPRKRKPLNQ